MITSMTGFGLASRKNNDFSIDVNIKSTNNRLFDLNIKMPSTIHPLEKIIHDSVNHNLLEVPFNCIVKLK